MLKTISLMCIGAAFSFTNVMAADEPVDLDIINKIRDQAFNHSEVMETLQHLTDVIGPRMPNTPQMKEANRWTMEQLSEWGLEDVHKEGFEFGRGWTFSKTQINMTSPRELQLSGLPVAWHPGTSGRIEGEVVEAQIRSKADFEKYKGKLKGKIVLLSKPRAFGAPKDNSERRISDHDLKAMETFIVPNNPGEGGLGRFGKGILFAGKIDAFLAKEGAIAALKASPRGEGLIEASGYQHRVGKTPKVPYASLTAEDYSRLIRLQRTGSKVKVSMDIDVQFHDDGTQSYSTIGEIKGRGRNPDIVMAGGHLDSWFPGDGAADDGAGVAVVMEAVRILKAIGVKPKRTIRVALWGGEEQGYYGSAQYVRDHFAFRPIDEKEEYQTLPPYDISEYNWPITVKKDHDRLSGYFNLDNGSGRIRGVYTEGNAAVHPIFQAWLKPFTDLGASTLTPQRTGGTDHEPFQNIGLPGFQFIQDELDYSATMHHSQVDTFDNVSPKDLKQASAIMASFLYHAAMRDEKLPRQAFPTKDMERVDFGGPR